MHSFAQNILIQKHWRKLMMSTCFCLCSFMCFVLLLMAWSNERGYTCAFVTLWKSYPFQMISKYRYCTIHRYQYYLFYNCILYFI
jgi:hypothetical protein